MKYNKMSFRNFVVVNSSSRNATKVHILIAVQHNESDCDHLFFAIYILFQKEVFAWNVCPTNWRDRVYIGTAFAEFIWMIKFYF